MVKLCVVIPAFNEAARIGPVVRGACAYGSPVLVVDDGSTDGTAEAARAAGAEILRHDVNRGKGAALCTGFQEALRRNCEVVVTMDGDGQHDPAELAGFLEAYQRTGIPVLLGNRMGEPKAMPILRLLTNRGMSWLLSRLMGHYIPDTQCGFRLYQRDVLPLVMAESAGYAAESEVLLRLAARGVRMDAVRIGTVYAREKSKISPVRDSWQFVRMLVGHRRMLRAWRNN